MFYGPNPMILVLILKIEDYYKSAETGYESISRRNTLSFSLNYKLPSLETILGFVKIDSIGETGEFKSNFYTSSSTIEARSVTIFALFIKVGTCMIFV